jgi:hypothetical protein
MECEFCKNKFNSKYVLGNHQKRAKYCIEIQKKNGINNETELFKCQDCGIEIAKNSKDRHLSVCKNKFINHIKDLEQKIIEKDLLIFELKSELKIYKKLSDRTQECIEEIAKQPRNYNIWETIVEIEEKTDTHEETTNESYELVPLELDNGYIIESRDSDSYIDVTNLCKAGKKEFKHWNSLSKTKAFLEELASKVGIPTVELVNQNEGLNGNIHTWVHPQVAINIAQWISPQFDVKVSAWVLEVMMTGKIDITNTKSYRELQQDNKNKQLKIQLMTKKYVKKQPRAQYDERNVIYILTTANMKKERRYILGKATNLTSRLSVYNKSDEHELVYYQECPNEEKMSLVESLVFCKLDQYREQANRERFLLPEGARIDLFSDTIRECIKFTYI